jgi:CDP-diacylglycerol--glycerol-3-phosphate 3-phosphatidyltransferase
MTIETHNPRTLRLLQQKWSVTAAVGGSLWLGFFFWLRGYWGSLHAGRWLFFSGLALVYLLWTLWRGLSDNHRHGDSVLLPSFGWGNLLSVGRGFILVQFCGFLFSPRPDGGWIAWLPGLIYTMAVLPDFLDGIAARLTNHVTVLGETLDVSTDSLALLAVSLLSVQYGQLPWWYLPVGLARYLFLAGIWIRQRLGLPVQDLPFSVRRRGFAGLTMGLFFVILYPVFRPPGTYLAAAVFAPYLLGGFLWDWFITIGWLPTQPIPRLQRWQNRITRYLPLALRILLAAWWLIALLPQLSTHTGSILLWAQGAAALCLVLGIAGRITAIISLVLLGIQQASAPLAPLQLGLILLYANLLFLGTGAFSLWPVENRLIYHRVGDS